MPDTDPIAAIAVLLQVHVPPPALLNVTVEPPEHIGTFPDMATGRLVTFSIVVVVQPP